MGLPEEGSSPSNEYHLLDFQDLELKEELPYQPFADTMAADAGKGGGSHGLGGQGIHLLPEYDGSRRKGAYREWRKQVLAYQFGYDVEPKLLAPRVWLRLKGEAKDAVDTLDIDELAKDDGMKKLLAILDKEFDQDTICVI